MFDIIGDVHGHHKNLITLLKKLGYRDDGISYVHASRKAIFVGDLINKGPDVKKVLETVKAMADRGAARVILGNHEYYLICYTSKDKSGAFLRKHTPKNTKQLTTTLKSFKGERNALFSYVKWFRTLPLYIDDPEIRVVHACWCPEEINLLKERNINSLESNDVLIESSRSDSLVYKAVRTMLEGVKIGLPVMVFNPDKNEYTNEIKSKWWINASKHTYKELAVKNAFEVPDIPVPPAYIQYDLSYLKNEKPLFFGHYCLHDKPSLMAGNLCCVDFCLVKRGVLTAYRWSGEQVLTSKNIVTQNSRNNINNVGRWIKGILPGSLF